MRRHNGHIWAPNLAPDAGPSVAWNVKENVRIVYTLVVAVSSDKPVIAYVRVSTEEQALSGLGLDAQRNILTTEAERRGWKRFALHRRRGKIRQGP